MRGISYNLSSNDCALFNTLIVVMVLSIILKFLQQFHKILRNLLTFCWGTRLQLTQQHSRFRFFCVLMRKSNVVKLRYLQWHGHIGRWLLHDWPSACRVGLLYNTRVRRSTAAHILIINIVRSITQEYQHITTYKKYVKLSTCQDWVKLYWSGWQFCFPSICLYFWGRLSRIYLLLLLILLWFRILTSCSSLCPCWLIFCVSFCYFCVDH